MKSTLENPYLAARREWNERYGEYVMAAHLWKLIAFGSLAIAFLALGGAIYMGTQSKLVPYVVATNAEGRIISAGLADKMAPGENTLRSVLSDWVGFHRSVVTDERVQRSYIEKTYAYILQGSSAKETLDLWYSDGHDPFTRMTKETVSVEVESVLLLSPKSYQLEWKERTFDLSGKPIAAPAFYRALMTIEEREVDSASLQKNPLGIFFKSISIQKIGG